MNKRLVMWGTFLVVFLASVVGSYKFINRNNQDLTMELSAPTLPLVSMKVGDSYYNVSHGYTGDVDAMDVAQYVCPVGTDRQLSGQIETLGEKITSVKYEVRNSNGSRLIETGSLAVLENTVDILDFEVKVKDLIQEGEEYIFSIILDTEKKSNVSYYTRFVYGKEFGVEEQMAFVLVLHVEHGAGGGVHHQHPLMLVQEHQTLAHAGHHCIQLGTLGAEVAHLLGQGLVLLGHTLQHGLELIIDIVVHGVVQVDAVDGEHQVPRKFLGQGGTQHDAQDDAGHQQAHSFREGCEDAGLRIRNAQHHTIGQAASVVHADLAQGVG